jgi:hypothetical protein
VFILLLSVLVPLVGGIPFMLFLTRVKKIGMVLIMAALIGLFLCPALAALPFLLLLVSRRWTASFMYAAVYALTYLGELFFVQNTRAFSI